MTLPAVAHTAEFQRVASLPRRVWTAENLAWLTSELSFLLRTPAGARDGAALRPVQALALHDAGIEGGLFGAIGVGEGKTLVELLLPLIWNAQRPLMLIPATLLKKTQHDRLRYAQHWRIPNNLRLFNYGLLGRVQSADELERYTPDVLILEEAHKLKNKRAACTRRVMRYMHEHPETRVAALSGTVMSKSLKDFAHILLWSLKMRAPMPVRTEEIEEWASALDVDVEPMARYKPGALLEFASECSGDETVDARRGFQRRLVETPGVVATAGDGERVDASIYVRAIRHKVAPVTEHNFLILRGDGKPADVTECPGWQTPDGWELTTAAEVWQHAQELALGLFYRWNPRPTDDWREARRAWHAFARETIWRGRTYDSEMHVANGIDAGDLPQGVEVLERWRRIGPTFKPHTEAVWCDDSALHAVADWVKMQGSAGGLVWTEHTFFAERLSKVTGLPYYGRKGYTIDGRYIECAKPGTSAIASIDANREGKNLQGIWSRNLLVCPPTSAEWWQQMIARTHRPGQLADEVTVDVLLGCRENFGACMKALEGAQAIQDTTGNQQKLLLADVTFPSEAEIDALRSPRWSRPAR
jgi:hypothetical protein